MFWLLDLVNTNSWKLFQNLNHSFLSYSTGNRDTRSHRKFLEILVDLIFLCTDESYPGSVPIPPEDRLFDYSRFPYHPREVKKRKAINDLLEYLPLRGIPGRPRDSYS
jgi:hypothetical protein